MRRPARTGSARRGGCAGTGRRISASHAYAGADCGAGFAARESTKPGLDSSGLFVTSLPDLLATQKKSHPATADFARECATASIAHRP